MASVTIVDVFARDGLQTLLHEPGLRIPSTDEKIQIIRDLDAAGVPEIEITGFVHPKVIPSLADAEDVARAVVGAGLKAKIRAMVPNVRGAERAIAVGVPKLSLLIIASDTYSRLNSNMSVERNAEIVTEIAKLARDAGVEVAVGMGTSFLCPYEGLIAEDRILRLIDGFVAAGIGEVSLADSIGMAWPSLVRQRVSAVLSRWPDLRLGLHLHTLAGQALANAFVGYEAGVTILEGSVGGIGGGIAMPVHTTNMGNVATEDLVYLMESCGVTTGVDQIKLVKCGRESQAMIGTGNGFTTSFGSLAAFLEVSRSRLGEMRAAPPGDSRKQAEARSHD